MVKPTIEDLLTRNVEDIIVRADLEKKLRSGKKLRVKLGFDPTGDKIHLGRAQVLWKLRAFQELGHKVVFIIGDFTAQIGDASDKDSQRPMLTPAEIKTHLKHYLDQVGLIVDLGKAEFHYNSEWFSKLKLDELVKLASVFTVQQMIERENFALRIKAGKPVGLHEVLYPVMQGYDSIQVKADVELGGTDQTFNLLAGRTLQKYVGQSPQNVITFAMLEGLDGRKMSTSWGNCIWITDDALTMYGKVMSLRDELIIQYLMLATDMPTAQVSAIEKNLADGANPRDAKAALARRIAERYHGPATAKTAEAAWNAQFREGKTPTDLPTLTLSARKTYAPVDLVSEHFKLSRSQARRLIEQGGVRIDEQTISEADRITPKAGMIIAVGKRRLVRVKLT